MTDTAVIIEVEAMERYENSTVCYMPSGPIIGVLVVKSDTSIKDVCTVLLKKLKLENLLNIPKGLIKYPGVDSFVSILHGTDPTVTIENILLLKPNNFNFRICITENIENISEFRGKIDLYDDIVQIVLEKYTTNRYSQTNSVSKESNGMTTDPSTSSHIPFHKNHWNEYFQGQLALLEQRGKRMKEACYQPENFYNIQNPTTLAPDVNHILTVERPSPQPGNVLEVVEHTPEYGCLSDGIEASIDKNQFYTENEIKQNSIPVISQDVCENNIFQTGHGFITYDPITGIPYHQQFCENIYGETIDPSLIQFDSTTGEFNQMSDETEENNGF